MGLTRGLVFKSFFWKYSERFIVQVFNFVLTILLARLLSPNEYGIVALIMVFVNIANVIVEGGLNTALIQRKNADESDFSTTFFFCIIVSFIMYAIMYFCAPLISSFYHNDELVPVIRILSLLLILYAINSIQQAYIAKKMLFRKLFICSIISIIVSGVVGVLLAYRGLGVWALVSQLLINHIVLIIMMFFLISWRPSFFFSIRKLIPLLDFGWKIFLSNLIVAVFVNMRKLVIGRVFTASSLAFFEKGEQFPNIIMNNINSSVQAVLLPTFSEYQNDRDAIKRMLYRATTLSCFFIYPLLIYLIVVAKPLVVLILTEKWAPAALFLQILAIACFFRPVTLANLEAIKAMGYSDVFLKLEIVKKIVDIIILFISVLLGVYAIAWGVVLYDLVCVILNLYPNKRLLNYGIWEQVKDVMPILLISLFTGGIVFFVQFLQLPSFVTIVLQLLLGLTIYMTLCLIFKEKSFVYILSIIRTKRNLRS